LCRQMEIKTGSIVYGTSPQYIFTAEVCGGL
jgi:hypothetical protein